MKASTTPVVAAAAGIIYKSSKRTGRGVPQITNVYAEKCSCDRNKTMVFCRACGYYCHGRVRLTCKQHPRVSYFIAATSICIKYYIRRYAQF